jgi:uncharacterized delta-60 repeat protein
MRKFFTPLFLLTFYCALAQTDGTLDPTWGNHNNGTSTVSPGIVSATDRQRVFVLGNNYILQTFTISNATNDFGLARYDPDGNLDVTFGGGTGFITTDFGGDDRANALAVQSDGKIVVVGTSYSSGSGKFAVARYTANGGVDGTFGGGTGKVTTTISADDAAYAVVIQPDGKIVVGGSSGNSSAVYSFALVRYLTNGSLDNAAGVFGTGGKVTTTISQLAQINALLIQPDSKIVAVGYSSDLSDFDYALARYSTTGTLDNGFGSGGIVTTDFGMLRDDAAYSVVISNLGKLFVGGYTDNGTGVTPDNDYALARYNTDGSLDNSGTGPFASNGGLVTTDFGANEISYDMVGRFDGKLIMMGTSYTGSLPGTNSDFALSRYTLDGNLDVNFGSSGNGKQLIDFGASNDLGLAVSLGPTYIIASGITDMGGSQLALARLTNATQILPINLFTFTASRQGNATRLNWQTRSERQTLAFEVLKSSDGRNFTSIGEVSASGNSDVTRDYSFTDPAPLQPLCFYRLRIINLTASSGYSQILIVRNNEKAAPEAFPNPVRDLLHIQFTEPAGPVRLQVTDAAGRMVSAWEMKSVGTSMSSTVDLGSLAPGIYYLSVNGKILPLIKQ